MSPKANSSRVTKTRSEPKSTIERNKLLAVILASFVEMPACSFCEARGLPTCQVSPGDPSRCAECVRQGASGCDVLSPTPNEVERIRLQYQKLEEQIEAEEERLRESAARIERLRKQKKMWRAKQSRVLRRGLDSIAELDRVEAEEASRAATAAAGEESRPDQGLVDLGLSGDFDWNSAEWAGLDLGVDLNVGPNVVSPKAGS